MWWHFHGDQILTFAYCKYGSRNVTGNVYTSSSTSCFQKCRCLPCLAFCEIRDIRMQFFCRLLQFTGTSVSTWLRLQYIYTEEIPSGLPVQQLAELICLGNQYGLTLLAETCAERLSSMLSAQNVVAVLQVLGRNESSLTRFQQDATLLILGKLWFRSFSDWFVFTCRCVHSKSTMKCNRGCSHWTPGMSTSLGQILEQTTAKVSKDPELMRAIVSKLCKIPEWSDLRQEPRHGACRMARRIARARFEVKKWTVPPHMPPPHRTQITFDWRCHENRWGEARFPGFLRPFPRPWWPSTDLPWPQCGAEVLPMASLHRKLDEVNVACDTWPTWQMWQNIRQTWGATDMAAKSQVQDPSPVCFFVSEKSGLESVSSLHTSGLYLVLLEPETSVDKWLFQLDDSKSLHGKWLFKQTSRHPFKTGGSGFQEGIISQFHQISSNILKWSLLYNMCISVKVVYMHSFTIQISPISIDLSCRYSFESTLAQKHPVTVLREWKWLLEETSTHSVPWMQRTRLKQPGSDHPIVQPIY